MWKPWTLLCSALVLTSCDGLCGNDLLNEVTSPTGEYVAAVFERNCGATTPYITGVILRGSGERFDPERFEDWVLAIEERSDASAVWISPDALEVTYTSSGAPRTKRTEWRGITVKYKQ